MDGLRGGKCGLNPELIAVEKIRNLANVESLLAARDANVQGRAVEIEVGAVGEKKKRKQKKDCQCSRNGIWSLSHTLPF